MSRVRVGQAADITLPDEAPRKLGVSEGDYPVSGDKRHLLPLGRYEGIKIVTARRFLVPS